MRTSPTRAAALAAIAVALLAMPTAAQDMPDAKTLLEKYHANINAAAWANVQSMHSTGEFSLPAQGLSATFEAMSARPSRTAVKVDIPGIGELRMGFFNGKGWTVSSFEGARLYEGAEQAQAADDAHFDSVLRTAELVTSMTTVERTRLAGTDCWKVKVVWKSGRETHDCYGVESGLLIGSMYRHESNAGTGDAVALYDDYREFGGVKLPTKITTQILGMEQIITLREVKLNEVADSALEPPPAIRTLMGG